MTSSLRALIVFAGVTLVYLIVGFTQSWTLAFTILNDGLIVAIMSLGVNMQWGYAGLLNIGVVGFFGLGGLAVVLITTPMDGAAWAAGTPRIALGLIFGAALCYGVYRLWKAMAPGKLRNVTTIVVIVVGYAIFRMIYAPAVTAVEANDPASAGNIGGLGLPMPFSWIVAGLFGAAAAWGVAKTALGLRSDYLAIATLGIGQIIIALLMNENWLDRGVQNVTNIGRWPVPFEVDLQKEAWFISLAHSWGSDVRTASTVFVGACFALVFFAILLVILILAELSLKSPWGRMMRAIRDNEVAAEAMGKDVKRRHLQVFILGSAVIGVAGALYVMLHGLAAPQSYNNPLRYTFLIWAMVILGGSGNNWGSVAGALIIMMMWDEAGTVGPAILGFLTSPLPAGVVKSHLIDNAVQMRLPMVGAVLLLVLRFSPRGLIPEK